jgi:polysaccharide export outer membrane protein
LDTLDSTKAYTIQRVQKSDRLNITISSTDPSLTAFLNPFGIISNNTNVNSAGYLVDTEGQIDFPLLGKVKVESLTTNEVAKLIKEKLNYFYKDLFVNVNLSGKVYIINGTEGSSIPINNERLTILEAMALSGQKSDINPKNDVWVIREDSGRRAYGKIDLTSRELFASPYFYLKSNDLIYIKPNPYSWIISQSSPVRLILSLIGSISALIILITKL